MPDLDVSDFDLLDVVQLFPFPLDEFQHRAIAALNEGQSVVVCVPTGSGKTLVGEYAIHRALAQGKRVFYTTPLKALSNQKLRDFKNQFGADKVGLLTGDASVNREASVLVMTTEIFRNMLYGTPIGEVGTSLQGVDAVVLDECHYMNDRQRGTVWEESVIYCPPEVQLVALSATIDNSDQLTDWIQVVHGPTQLIHSDFRPVPLRFHFCNAKGLFPLLDSQKKRLNPKLRSRGRRDALKGKGRRSVKDGPNLPFILSQLQQRDMLPAIYFIFSRKGCDKAVREVEHLQLVTDQEALQLKERVDEFLAQTPEAARAGQVEPLYRGIAAHHAGILPAWKGLVEELFQSGLIKVVFATETLAAGINMPARTTVISTLSKRVDYGHRLLLGSEFLQMAGRAGRRGMDPVGHVVTVQSRFEGAEDAAYLATTGADPLASQFTPSYGMVLNLLQTHTLEEAQELIERSFGQYLATLHLKPQQQAIAQLQQELAHHQEAFGYVDESLLAGYEKLKGRLKEARRLLKILQRQATEVAEAEIAQAINFTLPGTVLSLKGTAGPIPAILVAKVPSKTDLPLLICLEQENQWRVAAVSDIVRIHAEYSRFAVVDTLAPPKALLWQAGNRLEGDGETGAIAEEIPTPPVDSTLAPEVRDQLQEVEAIDAELKAHPAQEWGNPGQLLKRRKRMHKIEQELRERQFQLNRLTQKHWQAFTDLMVILQEFGGLDDVTPTPLGQIAAAIRGDNELWLGLALRSGELDDLAPHQLAAACAALVTETPRSDSWAAYACSPEVEEALGGLRSTRRRLARRQRRDQVDLPVWLEFELIALIEQWALGETWPDLCSNTSLDEGDVVRVMRRTLDFLAQIPHVPHISEGLRNSARQATQLIDRFPINEVL